MIWAGFILIIMSTLSFAERIRAKSNTGFDNKVKKDIAEKRERAEVVAATAFKGGKKMPK